MAYDCSGAVLLMGTIVGGLITGTCSGVWAWIKWNDRAFMIGSTSMLMGMVLVSLFEAFMHAVIEISVIKSWPGGARPLLGAPNNFFVVNKL